MKKEYQETCNTAPQPSSWMAQPIRKKWLGDPLVLDCAFQLMILWSFENSGAGSLPTSLDGYRLYKKSFADAKNQNKYKNPQTK